jgi:hypothetical protein
MRKEARDGEGNVMPEAELRDEMFQGEFISSSRSFYIPAYSMLASFATFVAMLAGQESSR